MQTKKQQLQALAHLYRKETGIQAVNPKDLADWASSRGCKPPIPRTPAQLLAAQFSDAMREEYAKDEVTGHPYRVNMAVVEYDGDEQVSLFMENDFAPRAFAHKSCNRRREHIASEVTQLHLDAARWNRMHPTEEPIQMELDYTFDVELKLNAVSDVEQKAA